MGFARILKLFHFQYKTFLQFYNKVLNFYANKYIVRVMELRELYVRYIKLMSRPRMDKQPLRNNTHSRVT